MMQISRKLSRVLKASIFIQPQRFPLSFVEEDPQHSLAQRRGFSLQNTTPLSGFTNRSQLLVRASYATEASSPDEGPAPTETVKEIYDKMFKSVDGERKMPPNALLSSLIAKCANEEDIKLLFQMLEKLRIFRLSNLRIHKNFNSNLCLRVTEACARVGAIEYGAHSEIAEEKQRNTLSRRVTVGFCLAIVLIARSSIRRALVVEDNGEYVDNGDNEDCGKKVLLEHNVYGFTPSVGSANYLLTYAKEHNDAKLMKGIMKLMQMNHLSLQPSTADIVFKDLKDKKMTFLANRNRRSGLIRPNASSDDDTRISRHNKNMGFRICYNANNWVLISTYSKKFIKAKAKLRRTTFDTWMEFAAKIGNVEALGKIEKLRSKVLKQHTLGSGFSCAKGFLLKHEPESAAAIIHILSQNLAEKVKPEISVELQKLMSEWPLEVIKRQKKADREALASSLKNDIPMMINCLSSMGLEAMVNLDDLTKMEAIPS
ncbi:hypothetical protein GIB67_034532 [Kingdonia uniflora]|uniref:Uncharacterized protein n=1 Tax=Kingdonia uniflora TaxID=39325 RepID=A0A7J7PBG0_9MAGN|nr:hypothetical protein GIB67_034532 [Kingdonia uniflora]